MCDLEGAHSKKKKKGIDAAARLEILCRVPLTPPAVFCAQPLFLQPTSLLSHFKCTRLLPSFPLPHPLMDSPSTDVTFLSLLLTPVVNTLAWWQRRQHPELFLEQSRRYPRGLRQLGLWTFLAQSADEVLARKVCGAAGKRCTLHNVTGQGWQLAATGCQESSPPICSNQPYCIYPAGASLV